MTLASLRDALKNEKVFPPDEETCRLVIEKIYESDAWLHREFTDAEIRNAIRAILKELKS